MYFVMLNHPNPDIPAMPLIDTGTDNIGFFETEVEAGWAAESSALGEAQGYEVFKLGQGVEATCPACGK